MDAKIHRYSVRYHYTVKDGFETLPGGKREQKYKTITRTKKVECESADATEKEIIAILADSHRKEEPTDFKLSSVEKVGEPQAQQKSPLLTEKQEELVEELMAQVAAQEVRIADLESRVGLLEDHDKKHKTGKTG